MTKDNISNKNPNHLSLNDTEIPTLGAQTANQLLNNVFTVCDMTPSVIPVETLESWGNYKKPSFNLGRFIAYIFTILLVLLPLMFFRPTIIAERTNVESTSDAVYDIRIKTLLPVSSVSAELDGTPIALSETSSREYIAKLTENGSMTITVRSFNGQIATRTYKVSHLDTENPKLLRSYSQNGLVYLELLDAYSSINYDKITGLTPESYDTTTGTVVFKIPATSTTVTIPDNAGNELTLLLSPVN